MRNTELSKVREPGDVDAESSGEPGISTMRYEIKFNSENVNGYIR